MPEMARHSPRRATRTAQARLAAMLRREEHLESRQVLGDQLQEAIAHHEDGGRGEHGGDAAEIGTSGHGLI